jgi:hypothetical protein
MGTFGIKKRAERRGEEEKRRGERREEDRKQKTLSSVNQILLFT